MSGSLPSVSVVVPARDAERTLGDCLASLRHLDYPTERLEVIVVDDGSADRTAEIAAAHPGGRCLRGEHRGRSWARNRGIDAARGDVIAFTDADCVATTGWLRELVGGLETRGAGSAAGDGAWAAAGEILAYPPSTAVERYAAGRHVHWQRDALRLSRPFAATPNVAFRREVFDVVGRFDPALPRAQDKDFGWRFFNAGLRMEYSPRAVVLHRHPATAWALFKQHAGWGYGAALLHAKYDLPWGVRQELEKYGELAGALVGALAEHARSSPKGNNQTEPVTFRYLEVTRRLGLRAGALRGLLETRGGRVPRRP